MRDELFIRGPVPMTKSEVRAVVLSKLELTAAESAGKLPSSQPAGENTAVLYDIGAGTGSVSVEAAQLMKMGTIYAVEQKAEAVELIQKNKAKFNARQIEIVHGMAPEILKDLPAPTHVFIGGSLGQADRILHCVMKKNPNVRVVMTAITLETLGGVMEFIRNNGIHAEILLLSVSKARKAGDYHMMQAENPIYIVSFGGEEDCYEETLS